MIGEADDAIGLLERFRSTWESRNPLFLLLTVAIAVLLTISATYLIDWSQSDLSKVIKNWSLFILLSCLLSLATGLVQISWYISVRPRRMPSNKIGILFAIETENKKQKKLVQKNFTRDFVSVVRSNTNQEYSVQFISDYFTKKITEDKTLSTRVVNRANGNLILYGRIEERQKDGNEIYVLTFDESVRHRPIALDESARFGAAMRQILPAETLFSVSDEYNGFTFSSRIFGLGSKYILGVAAFYSDRLELSFQLLKDSVRLSTEVLQLYVNEPATKQIQERLPRTIVKVCQRGATLKVMGEKDYGQGLEWANRGLEIDSNDYDLNLFASSCLFKLGDFEAATRHVELAARNTKDYTWAWSKAFLIAYSGRLQESYELYKYAFSRPAVKNVASQCEVFIAETLENEPEKVQFYYCLGLINLLVKEDWVLAEEFFETFISESKRRGVFVEFVVYANKYMETARLKATAS